MIFIQGIQNLTIYKHLRKFHSCQTEIQLYRMDTIMAGVAKWVSFGFLHPTSCVSTFQMNLPPPFSGCLNSVQVCAEASETSDQIISYIVRNQSIIIVYNEVRRIFVDICGRCNALNIFQYPPMRLGDRGSTVVKVLCYKSEGHWFDPSWCQWVLHWHKIFPITLWPWGRLSL